MVNSGEINSQDFEENIHYAVSKEACKKMGKKYQWELIDAEDTTDSVLKAKCIFKGKQTHFSDLWNDHQDN
jgi:hypothetical protein